jgi:NADH:ubiquinone oxidoreductase subunit E
MQSSTKPHIAEFDLEGRFLAFVINDGKVKHLRVAVDDRELQIKLSKQAKASIYQVFEQSPLRPLDVIRVCGEILCDRDTGECKLKAYCIEKDRVQSSQSENIGETPSPLPASPSPKPLTQLKLLICQKSGCQKRGGKQHYRHLQRVLIDRALHHVTIEQTGCLGKCSMAPNVMLMPGKKRLSGMKPEAIADLLEALP